MRSIRGVRRARDGVALVAILASYWTTVFPVARRELARWRALAATIPDARLRTLALDTLDHESGLAEGAAIFATLVPRGEARRRLVALLVAWQVMYDYLDTLGEQRAASSSREGMGAYAVLATALETPAAEQVPAGADGGYLSRLVACCRTSVATFPSIDAVRPFAVRAALRCAEAQALTHAAASRGVEPLRRWALAQPGAEPFLWWEVAAGAISSLGVHALLATAALPRATAAETARVDAAYFPSICALSTLLDSTIDAADDADTTNHRCTAYYASDAEAAARLETVTRIAASAARGLPHGRGHAVILAGMTAYYAASGWTGNERLHRRVASAIGVDTALILWTLRARARLSVHGQPAAKSGRDARRLRGWGDRNGDGGRAGRGRTPRTRMVHVTLRDPSANAPARRWGIRLKTLRGGRRRAGRPRS
jgi:tetraprenyl-beta-curcumene synthase